MNRIGSSRRLTTRQLTTSETEGCEVFHVWIDQDLCTGDGLCTDHCPEVFVLLEDGISYVRDQAGIKDDPGGRGGLAAVADKLEQAVIGAALDCPGECIFIEVPTQVIAAYDRGDGLDDAPAPRSTSSLTSRSTPGSTSGSSAALPRAANVD